MDHDVLMFAQVMAIIVATVASLVAVGVGARALWRVGNRTASEVKGATPAQLQHIETALDAIAIEVERISEGQRYTMNVLSDRLPARSEDKPLQVSARELSQEHDIPR